MSSKSAYRYSVENSIYLGQAAAGKGLGRALLEALIAACEQAGIREMVAVISDKGAEASVALHEKLGFVEVGRMGRVGFKFGRWLGTIYLQKHLKPAKKKASLRALSQRGPSRRGSVRRLGGRLARRRAHRVDELAPRALHLGVGERRLALRVPAPGVDAPDEPVRARRRDGAESGRRHPTGTPSMRAIQLRCLVRVGLRVPGRGAGRRTRRCGVTVTAIATTAARGRRLSGRLGRVCGASGSCRRLPSSSTPTPVQPARTASTSSDPSPYSASAAARVARANVVKSAVDGSVPEVSVRYQISPARSHAWPPSARRREVERVVRDAGVDVHAAVVVAASAT